MAAPVIVVAAFGSRRPEAVALLEQVLARTRKKFSGYQVLGAGLSSVSPFPNLNTVLSEVTPSAVFPLLVTDGGEMKRVRRICAELAPYCRVGVPLLDSLWSCEDLAQLLMPCLSQGKHHVLACHGSRTDDDVAQFYGPLAERVRTKITGELYLATVEGEPGTSALDALEGRVVRMLPLFWLPGKHVQEDIMGAHEESWRIRYRLELEAAPVLAEQDTVVDYWLDRNQATSALSSP